MQESFGSAAVASAVFSIVSMDADKFISSPGNPGNLNNFRAILDNDIAFNAYREGKQRF
jgi:hypothetical protein